MKLEMELGMNQAEATLFEWRGTDQGTQLKEGGSSGFEALWEGKEMPVVSLKVLITIPHSGIPQVIHGPW